MANNNVGLGRRRSGFGYASVLQGKSSEPIGSKAFRNVIENLFKQEDTVVRDGMTDEERYNILVNKSIENVPKADNEKLKLLLNCSLVLMKL